MEEITQPSVLRRVGIIGDVHGEDRALYAVLDFLLHAPDLDALLCTGDLMDTRSVGDVNRCCQLLGDADVYTVLGDFDAAYYENAQFRAAFKNAAMTPASIAFVTGLPHSRTFDTSLGPMLLCHGFGEDELQRITPHANQPEIVAALKEHHLEACRFIIAGHSHDRMVRRADDTLLINAGSLFWEDPPCFLIADFDAGFAQFYEVEPFTNRITPAESVPLTSAELAVAA